MPAYTLKVYDAQSNKLCAEYDLRDYSFEEGIVTRTCLIAGKLVATHYNKVTLTPLFPTHDTNIFHTHVWTALKEIDDGDI